MTAALLHYAETAQWQASPGMYSTVSVLLLKRSGSEHDLTGWPDNIPTSPGVCLAFQTAT